MNDLKSKIEAVLFSSGRKMNTEEIAKLCHSTIKQVETALAQLSDEYDQNKNSLMIVNEKQDWKLTVHEKYLNVVRKIVPETELTKTIMETLAVVAWKSPVLQSEVIKIRTNKAYDHLDQLEEMAFIFRKKEGRTKNILLTEKFYFVTMIGNGYGIVAAAIPFVLIAILASMILTEKKQKMGWVITIVAASGRSIVPFGIVLVDEL